VTNTLAYYDTELITAEQSFVVKAPEYQNELNWIKSENII